MLKMCNFYLGEGGVAQSLKTFLVIGQSKWPLPQKEKKRRVWDAPQLIKSININHKLL
jgi:hypothetical protein